MTDSIDRIRAPQHAVAWVPETGYLYEPSEVPTHLEAGAVVLVVGSDGYVRGVTHAELAAVLRIDGDLDQLVQRVEELGDRAAGLDTGLAVEVAALRGRVRQLENRGPG